MFRRRKLLKGAAIFMALEIVVNTFLPGVSHALTSGPTAPEATSFEPVDASGMVNLNTGDMTYNLPIVEIPGPAGNYPLSLSYHAGINPSQEASWVGLGWNINPGSISRSVSGYPDDWNNVSAYQKEAWIGGNTDRIQAGLSASWWGVTISSGLIYTNDTYQGTGWGSYSSVSYGWSYGGSGDYSLGGGVGIRATNDPMGGSSITGYDQLGFKADRISHSLGSQSTFTMNSVKSSFNGGVSANFGGYSSKSLLGASVSTNGASRSYSVVGVGLKSSNLHKSGNVITSNETSDIGKFLNAFVTGPAGFTKERYKYDIDEKQIDGVYGSIYNVPEENTQAFFDSHDFDTYDMFEVEDENNDPEYITYSEYGLGNEMMLGGSLPAYDSYTVMGQGTGGSMRPYDFLSTLYRQNKNNTGDNSLVKQYVSEGLPRNQPRSEFMFSGEFSNKYLYQEEDFEVPTDLVNSPLTYAFDQSAIESFKGSIDENDNRLGRASNIEWFTNKDIISGINLKGLTKPSAQGLTRDENDQIGAFMVTNSSGVTYHYALPAYTYDENYVSENLAFEDHKEGDFRTVVSRQEKYAYTWFLTAVTGPDYVDRNNNSLVDDGDWGYWIEFEYGKWASDYKWRSPEKGYIEDLDANYRNFSTGKKELYYLNAVRSASHTALFVKDVRNDGKGLSNLDDFSTDPKTQASFEPKSCSNYPTSLLKLSKIVLIQNDQLEFVDYHLNDSNSEIEGCSEVQVHHGGNVLLSENISSSNVENFEQHAVKTIELNTDYSIVSKTLNSFENTEVYSSDPQLPTDRTGKLALNGISFYGKQMTNLMPPITFEYKDKEQPYCFDCQDYWGSYKSDFDPEVKDVNIKRMPTQNSAENADTWSLTKITTSLGAEINIDYESDDYSESVLHSKVNFPLSNVESGGNGEYSVYIEDLEGELDDYFTVGQDVSSFMAVAEAEEQEIEFHRMIFHPIHGYRPSGSDCDAVSHFKIKDIKTYFNEVKIKSIENDHLVLSVVKGDISGELPYASDPNSRVVDPGDTEELVKAADCQPENQNLPSLPLKFCQAYRTSTKNYKEFIAGELIANINERKVGGGIRVREIGVSDYSSDLTYLTNYDYNKPGTSTSSGVTSYVPFKMNRFNIEYPDHFLTSVDGYFVDGEYCSGGFFVNILKNYREMFYTFLVFGPTVHNLIEEVFNHDYPDRDDIEGFMHVGLSVNDAVIKYKRSKLMGDLLAKVNEAPSPGVQYQYVKVQNSTSRDFKADTRFGTQEFDNYALHEFIVFNNDLLSVETAHPKRTTESNGGTPYNAVTTRGVKIDNHALAVGAPKSTAIYDNNGNILNKVTYNYLHEQDNNLEKFRNGDLSSFEKFNKQGIIDETTVNGRFIPVGMDLLDVDDDEGNPIEEEVYEHELVGVVTKRRMYPVILVSEESKNYKTGISTSTKNLEYDKYSGLKTKSLVKDSYGNRVVTQAIPAYTKYSGMGLAINGGRHMLEQTAASLSYQVNNDYANDPVESNIEGLLSATAQTWGDRTEVLGAEEQAGIFRKNASYTWVGNEDLREDGLFEYSNFEEFNAWDGGIPSSESWQKNGEITLYDVYSHGLESKDINENYAATRMDPAQHVVIASAVNASYNEIAYSGLERVPFEGEIEGGVSFGDGFITNQRSHTGKFSLQVPYDGGQGFNYTLSATETNLDKKYIASVWVYVPGASETEEHISNVQLYYELEGEVFEAHPELQKNKSKSWYLLELEIDPQGADEVVVGCRNLTPRNAYFDDFRVHPLDATMTSYVYDQSTSELTYILDGNNFYKKFEYDAIGRLVRTSRELLNFDFGEGKESFRADQILNETIYNYGRNSQ